ERHVRTASHNGREAKRDGARTLQRRRRRLPRRCRRRKSETESETHPGMMMKRTLIVTAAGVMLFGCAALHHNKNENPYAKRLFIEQFLDSKNPLDARIQQTIIALRAN